MPEIKSDKLKTKEICCDVDHHSPFRRLFRVSIVCFIILVVFLLGIGVGRRDGSFYAQSGGKMVTLNWNGGAATLGAAPQNMMFARTNGASVQASGTVSGSAPVMTFTKAIPAGTRIAGTVTAINGTQITITDNGGTQQNVVSSADTVITSGNTEIPLSQLKVKQFIVAYVTAKSGINQAQAIQAQ